MNQNPLANLANNEMLKEIGTALAEAIKKHPEKAIGAAAVLGCVYLMKDKTFKVRLKKEDTEFSFETE